MRYFIGIKKDNKYEPLEISEIDNDILNIVNFTCSFDNILSFKKYLIKKGYITDSNVELVYLIEKGKKNSRTYEKIKFKNIYTNYAEEFFQLDTMREYIDENILDLDFITYLYGEYIKKYGMLDKIQKYLNNSLNNISTFISILKRLSKYVYSERLKGIFNDLMNYYENNQNSLNNQLFQEYAITFIEAIEIDNRDVINIFTFFKKYITFSNIPTLSSIRDLFRVVKDYEIKDDLKDSGDEEYDIEVFIERFINSIIYVYDSKTKQYKIENGKRKIQSRNLFDLGVLLENYNRYLIEFYESQCEDDDFKKPEEPFEDQYEDYEFLEEEDFKRIGVDIEEAGIKLRMKKEV